MGKRVDASDISGNKTLGLIDLGEQTISLFNFCIKLKNIMDSREPQTAAYYAEYESKLNFILAKMQYDGLGVDTNKLEAKKKEHQTKKATAIKNLTGLLNRPFNEDDLKAANIKSLLIEKLGLIPAQDKADKSSFLDHIKKNNGHSDSVLSNFTDYLTSVQRIIDIEKILKCADGDRIHPTFNHINTKTFRISAKDPNVQGFAKNEVREGIVAKKDNYKVSIDYSQFELKILAELSQDPVLINAFQKGIDIHKETASKIFEVPYEEVTEKQRKDAKAINFGLIYGKEAFSLAHDLGVTQPEAQAKIDLYFEKFPTIKRFLDKLVENAKRDGSVRTITGRRISIENINLDKKTDWLLVNQAERQAKNAPMQGSAADIIKKAMVKVYELIMAKYPNVIMTNQIHDELLFDVPKDVLPNFCVDAKNIMENIVTLSVPLSVDVEVGHNWWKQKLIDMSKYEAVRKAEPEPVI